MRLHSLVGVVVVVLGVVARCASGESTSLDTALCPACMDFVSDVEASLLTNATHTEIFKALAEMCKVLPLPEEARADCIQVFAEFAQNLNGTDEGVFYKYPSRAICGIPRLCTYDCCATPYTPEQIKLSLVGPPSKMGVTFTTLKPLENPVVQWGKAQGAYPSSAACTSRTYPNGGWIGWVHVCEMTDLDPATRYYYRVGEVEHSYWDHPNWSLIKTLSFVTEGARGPDVGIKMAFIADMGAMDVSEDTIYRVTTLTKTQEISFVVHAGDESYADGSSILWDAFLRRASAYASYIPVLYGFGNHEDFFNGAAARARLQTPSPGWYVNETYYWTTTYGNTRLIMLDTEKDFGLAPDLAYGGVQHAWLEEQLQIAEAQRDQYPWVIVMSHRPLYCPSMGAHDCDFFAPMFRRDIEPLFHKYHVDLHLSGHRHSYSRTYPVYDSQVMSKSYNSPNATVYVISGLSGCKEGLQSIPDQVPLWSAFQYYAEPGYSLVETTENSLTLTLHASYDNGIIDQVTITK